MILALIAPSGSVSPYYLIDKDVKMFASTKSKLALIGAGAAALASNASAALTATDVSMATASADVTTVVIAIIGLLVVVFGFRKVLGLLS